VVLRHSLLGAYIADYVAFAFMWRSASDSGWTAGTVKSERHINAKAT